MSEWAESCISEVGCRALVDLGYLPEKPLIGWRPAAGEAVPKPGTGEIVVFAHFFERGFSVPTHPFFRRLLDYYGLQLHHLNPNGILQISIFITLCEAYLGIEPHFGLWKWLYCVKPVSKPDPNNGCFCAVGGAGIQLRSKTPYVNIPLRTSIQLRSKAPYVNIPLRTSNKGWHSRWFYCRNEKPSLPDFVGDPPVKLPSWSDPPSAEEMAEVEKITPHLNGLIRNGLDGAHLITTFLSRRIQPIKKRCHPMSEFTGDSDPTRERLMKLTEDEIFSRVAHLVSTDTKISTDGKPLPYHHKQPVKHDLSKYLSVTLEEDEEGVMPQATAATAAATTTIVSQPPLKKLRTLGAASSAELVQQKVKEVVVCSCSELTQQRESSNSVPIAQPPPDDEDTETLSNRKKRKSAEALACSTVDPGLQDLSSIGSVAVKRKKKLSKDVILSLPPSSASLAREASGPASREAELTVPHPEEMPDDESVRMSAPQAACPLQSSSPTCHASLPTTLSTFTVEWEKIKEAATSFVATLPEIILSLKHASELVIKLKQENKELVDKLKQENEVARAFEKKASELSKELDIVRADRDSLSGRFQDAKKKAAELCDAFDAIRAACDKFSIDNPTPEGVAVVTK